MTPTSNQVAVTYGTTEEADAFWVEGDTPFLFTQTKLFWRGRGCLAKTALAFGSPTTHVRVPKELMALMSAVNPTSKPRTACTHSGWINHPSYLLALAVGT